MKSGDVFTLDTQSLDEIAKFNKVPLADVTKKLSDGDTFNIAKSDSGKGDVVYGSRWVDGKPQKGRPRRFPRATVARLLNEEYETESASEEAEVAEAEAEDDAALEEQAEALLASESADTSDSW